MALPTQPSPDSFEWVHSRCCESPAIFDAADSSWECGECLRICEVKTGADHFKTAKEWGDYLAAKWPWADGEPLYDEPPTPLSPAFLTRKPDFKPRTVDDPRPSIVVYAKRVSLRQGLRHPGDQFQERREDRAFFVHRLENGEVVQGELVDWPLEWISNPREARYREIEKEIEAAVILKMLGKV